MADVYQAKYSAQHLTDIDIAEILAFGKAEILQREIMSLMKCSKNVVQYTLAIYVFETFQRRNPQQEY